MPLAGEKGWSAALSRLRRRMWRRAPDMIFAEAVTELGQYGATFRRAVGVPVLANITEFGKKLDVVDSRGN